jgi:hypothetical protein
MMRKKLLVLLGLVAISPMLSAENHKITIKSSSVQKKVVVMLKADVEEKSVELECFLSQKSCTTLPPGDYLMVRLTNGGTYEDCPNVDIFSRVGDPTKDKPLGEYCLLQP